MGLEEAPGSGRGLAGRDKDGSEWRWMGLGGGWVHT